MSFGAGASFIHDYIFEEAIMSTLAEASALIPTHRYLRAAFLHFRGFINRSVASMLATWARQATRFMIAPGNTAIRGHRLP